MYPMEYHRLMPGGLLKQKNKMIYHRFVYPLIIALAFLQHGCKPPRPGETFAGADAAAKVYIAPGKYDEFYNFVSGGYNGQIVVYGLPSGRCLKIIPVFSVFPENGYGYSEETKLMLNTSHGFVPWDDLHHISLSQTNGEYDGRWVFGNGNNTPRIARINLKTFQTAEILEIPNSAGNHSSPYITENTEYIIASTRFSVPLGDETDVPINTYKENFKGSVSFVRVDPNSGRMNIAFQLVLPGLDFDLARAGKGKSHGWFFLSCYNSEKANEFLEVNASQNDKDFIIAINWKKAEEYLGQGKGQKVTSSPYVHNVLDEKTHTTNSEILNEVIQLDPLKLPGMVYMIPCPKSPHGCDTDPTGEYIVASGKLAALIPVFSFTKLQQAIAGNKTDGDFEGLPVLKYDEVLYGEVPKPGLGPLHTEFDAEGNAYTSMFITSEIVKWNVEKLEVLDRIPTYYSVGHLSVPGGDTKKPYGKYAIAYNKITKDRYLPTGPELNHSAQLFDISGEKMKLLLDFPTIGEPHYANAIPADIIQRNSAKIFRIEENENPYVSKKEAETKVVRNGKDVHVYMTAIRSHFVPDNIEGIKMGDNVYFHVTNLEQDWDVPHGFAIKGADNAELLILPGETKTLKWHPDRTGIFPFYCSDFCSALHQEMQGYLRVSPAKANVPITFNSPKAI